MRFFHQHYRMSRNSLTGAAETETFLSCCLNINLAYIDMQHRRNISRMFRICGAIFGI